MIINMPQPKRNIFLEDMDFEDDEKKDLRGWQYEDGCSCWRCQHFYDAAYWLVQKKETGETPPRLEYNEQETTSPKE
jgi:hypothetical protein